MRLVWLLALAVLGSACSTQQWIVRSIKEAELELHAHGGFASDVYKRQIHNSHLQTPTAAGSKRYRCGPEAWWFKPQTEIIVITARAKLLGDLWHLLGKKFCCSSSKFPSVRSITHTETLAARQRVLPVSNRKEKTSYSEIVNLF